jgi:hypothetical protein
VDDDAQWVAVVVHVFFVKSNLFLFFLKIFLKLMIREHGLGDNFCSWGTETITYFAA